MSAIGDLAKLLEQIPLWKKLAGLPGRLDALEERVRELETRLAARPAGPTCPRCGGGMAAIGEAPSRGMAGRAGARDRTLECGGCGYSTTILVKPSDV